jgi:hypothetical protein
MARCFSMPTGALIATAFVALTTACSSSEAPTAPGGSSEAALEAGVTLKVTSPQPIGPAGGVRTEESSPVLVAGPATARFTNDSPVLEYRFELQATDGSVLATSPKVAPAADGQVRWEVPFRLDIDRPYQWRARAELGERVGPWSVPASFVSPDYQGLNPRPANGRWPSNGPAVVAYIAAAWPQYLVPTSNLSQRIHNMEFLRDRIIEAGICGGLNVGRNLKRGVGPHSHDAIAYRRPSGHVDVIDIASGFDDHRARLGLHWQIVAGPPGFDPYRDHPGC